MRQACYCLLVILVIATLSCCASGVKIYHGYDIRLMALDDVAEDNIHYIMHKRVRLPAGQLKALITFLNENTTDDVAIDWKLKFYDGDGFELEETAWNTQLFPRGQETTIKTNSMSPAAHDFQVFIRGSAN